MTEGLVQSPDAEAADTAISVRISEIFYSIQGESRPAGFPTVFVRLTGCPLRCGYCDTTYAFYGGSRMTLAAIVAEVRYYQPRFVCVTGGEPLAQPGCIDLLRVLTTAGFEVSLETSGALDIGAVPAGVTVVMDIKTPGSGESQRNRLANIPVLKERDQVKFVICNRHDYEWSRDFCATHRLLERCSVLFSPSQDDLAARELAEWILEDRLQVRFQVQLHKYLWGNEPGH